MNIKYTYYNMYINQTKNNQTKVLIIIGDDGETVHKRTNKSGEVSYYGFIWDIWQKIYTKLKDKYNFKLFYSDETKDGNTDYNGFCESVHKGIYDIVIGHFYYTHTRQLLIKYTNPITIDNICILHYSKKSKLKHFLEIFIGNFKLLGGLIVIGIVFGVILAYMDKNRLSEYKGNEYILRVIITSISSMFGEMGFLTENTSLSITGLIVVIIIMICSFTTLMYIQGLITTNIINIEKEYIKRDNIYTKKIVGFKGNAISEKVLYLNPLSIKEVEFKNSPNPYIDIIEEYIHNLDTYDGVLFSYAACIPYLKKYPKIIVSSLGIQEPTGFVVSKDKYKLIFDINIIIEELKENHFLHKSCLSNFGKEVEETICSLI